MTLIKYDNFFNDPFSELDRWFEHAFGDTGRLAQYEPLASRQFRLDVYSDEDNHYVAAELPGFKKSDVSIDLHNAVLTIRAERKEEVNGKEHTHRFQRAVTVGDDVNAEKTKAKLEDGILTITLPKAEDRKPREITIG